MQVPWDSCKLIKYGGNLYFTEQLPSKLGKRDVIARDQTLNLSEPIIGDGEATH